MLGGWLLASSGHLTNASGTPLQYVPLRAWIGFRLSPDGKYRMTLIREQFRLPRLSTGLIALAAILAPTVQAAAGI